MSDWELVTDSGASGAPQSDWEIAPVAPNSRQQQSGETLGGALIKAPYRIGEDLIRGGFGAIKNIPSIVRASQEQVPAAFNTIRQNPGHALSQAGAGIAELGQNVFNTPHDLINYATNRLNLVPQGVNEKVQQARMPDSAQAINQAFGEKKDIGDELLRGIPRNALNIAGVGKAASVLNPANLTARSIANDVIREQRRQISSHTRRYNNLWRDAQRAGVHEVPISHNLINTNLDFIRQYKSPRDYRTLEYFNEHPTLPNAQSAVSDLRNMIRGLDDKSRTTSLSGEERNLYDALHHTQTHIENNMFLNPNGSLNQRLANRYRNISSSYRDNVVPYRYNKDIQAYINRELLPKELVNRLSRGEFAVKKGSPHPAIGIRNKLLSHPLIAGIGLGGAGKVIYDNMMGRESIEK
jgi:hypothetical protein